MELGRPWRSRELGRPPWRVAPPPPNFLGETLHLRGALWRRRRQGLWGAGWNRQGLWGAGRNRRNSRGRSGSGHSRGRSGSAHSRGRSGSANSRGRSGSANSRGRSGSANSRGRSGKDKDTGGELHRLGGRVILVESSVTVHTGGADEETRSFF